MDAILPLRRYPRWHSISYNSSGNCNSWISRCRQRRWCRCVRVLPFKLTLPKAPMRRWHSREITAVIAWRTINTVGSGRQRSSWNRAMYPNFPQDREGSPRRTNAAPLCHWPSNSRLGSRTQRIGRDRVTSVPAQQRRPPPTAGDNNSNETTIAVADKNNDDNIYKGRERI